MYCLGVECTVGNLQGRPSLSVSVFGKVKKNEESYILNVKSGKVNHWRRRGGRGRRKE